ncbi:uncharacterized protein LOC118438252 [Folsomia candida]|uniref:uncharacterized protein LOC118438252 n=1 Tax=Folsomia candida TaxID=158441 RepID=UPI0016053072|nr:uncharacterized protein LOC118438252 [Folsomia candida]
MQIRPHLIIPPAPTKSLLHGAKLPFRIQQFAGFLPLSITTPGSRKPLSLDCPPWYKSPSTLLPIFYTLLTLSPMTNSQDPDHYEQITAEYVSKGRNTFSAVTSCWGFCSIICPLLIRLYLVTSRKRVATFWQKFTAIVTILEANFAHEEGTLKTFLRKISVKCVVHISLQVTMSSFSTGVYLYFTNVVNSDFNIIGFMRDLSFSWLDFLTNFCLHGVIYFVMSYELCVTRLLNVLRDELNRKWLTNLGKVRSMVEFYYRLDNNVQEFNSLFGRVLNIYVVYTLGNLLYSIYFVVISFSTKDTFSGGFNLVKLALSTTYFYCLVNSSSELEEKSRMFAKRVKFIDYDDHDESRMTWVAEKIAIYKLSQSTNNQVC